MKFDKPTHKSPFLSFTAAEFHRRGSELRRELSNKTKVHRMLEDKSLGGTRIGLPTQHAVLTSPEQITSDVLGERAALKFAHGWSAKGVMLLERTAEDRYFDHFSLRELTLDAIRAKQHTIASHFPKKSPAWIIEDFLRGPQPGAAPFDYKFYMFQGQIGMVAQIDRNSSPARVVKLGGDLKPMVEDLHYRLASEDLQPGVPLVPRSAVMLSRWAIELSQMTDAPFVRVDLYDTESGPSFGEFTFSSGAEYKRTIMYSRKVLNRFDRMFVDAEKRLNGEPVDSPRSWSTLLQSTDSKILASQPYLNWVEYERFAAYLYNQGSRGAYRLAEAQKNLTEHGADAKINGYLTRAHAASAEWVESRHKLSEAVRVEAVRQIVDDGRDVKVVAEEVGLPRWRLAKLAKQARRTAQETNTSP